MSTTAISVAELRQIDLFDDLDDDELARWTAVTEMREFKAGDIVAEQGEHSQAMYLVLEGTVQALMVTNGRVEPTGQHRAPTWMGAIGILIEAPLGVRLQAETDCRLATVP